MAVRATAGTPWLGMAGYSAVLRSTCPATTNCRDDRSASPADLPLSGGSPPRGFPGSDPAAPATAPLRQVTARSTPGLLPRLAMALSRKQSSRVRALGGLPRPLSGRRPATAPAAAGAERQHRESSCTYPRPSRRRPVRGQPLASVEREKSTAASTCRRVVGKTGTGLSAVEISSSISVQPRTMPSAPASAKRVMMLR